MLSCNHFIQSDELVVLPPFAILLGSTQECRYHVFILGLLKKLYTSLALKKKSKLKQEQKETQTGSYFSRSFQQLVNGNMPKSLYFPTQFQT
jgi:hypothetical protein